MVKAYLKFLWKSKNEHAIHSPFVFDFYTKVIQNKAKVADFDKIENFRKLQLKNNQSIEVTDFGAGSKRHKSNTRQISEIAKLAEKKPKFGQLLYRMVQYFSPNTIFDLGTSLGITTLYQSKALNNNGSIYTFEGCPQIANEAKILFNTSYAHNINQIIGNIDETLPTQLSQIKQLDFAFFDANHRFEPTIRYFEQCMAKASEQSVFIFDDIHWSAEMEQAWNYIKKHEKVMISIDLFYVGIVFFRKNQPKQDFVLRF
jgi:predicted O-methyltransferase YrrM